MKFKIKHQVLKRTDTHTIVDLSQDYLTCRFKFISDEWEGLPKYVIFTSHDGINNLIYLGTDMEKTVYVPNSLLQGNKFRITVYGFVGTYRITTTRRTISIIPSGYTTDITPIDEDADEDFFSRISEEIEELNTIVSTKAELIHQHNISDVSNLVGVLDGKADTNHTHNEYLTEHQSLADYVKTNDSRLTDAREPLNHTHTKAEISDFNHTHDYDDLTNKPELFDGSYNSLTDKPELFTGSYDDLTDKPTLFSGNYEDLSNKPNLFSGNYEDLSNKPSLFSGNYNDLSNKPSIPSKISDLTDDSDFIEKSETSGLIKNDGSIDENSYALANHNHSGVYADASHDHTVSDITDFPTIPSKVSDLDNDSGFLTEHQSLSDYIQKSQTAGLVKNDGSIDTSNYLTNHQSLKTINNESIVGTGNITINAGTNVDIVTNANGWNNNLSDSKVPSEKLVKNSLDNKVDKETGKGLFSGNYNDLSNKPTIPSKTSDLTNDSNFLTSHQDITGKLDIAQTSYKGKNVVVDSTTGNITFENKPTIPTDVSQLSDNNNTAFTPKSHSHSEYVNPTIADNLTTNDATQVLSAKQGKILNDLIGQAITYINQ